MDLEPGTLIECDLFSSIVVRADLLLVFDTELSEYVNVGDQLRLKPLGPNDWSIAVLMDYGDRCDYLVKRDWHGQITTEYARDPWDDWLESDDDFDWEYMCSPTYDLVESYDDYRSLSSPARNPRVHRVVFGRGRWGGHRRR